MAALKIPTIYSAVDNYSPALRKMEKNTHLFADRVNASIARAERKFKSIGKSAVDVGRKSAIIGTAIVAPLALAAREAINFEDKMADVSKVANVAIGSTKFKELSEDAKRLGIFLGIGGIEAAGLMQNLAQGGVALDELDRVARIAGKVGVAFGIPGDVAGESFVKIKNALGGTIETTEKLMDSINFLGNTTAASSAQIVTAMASGGSAVARAANAEGSAVAAMTAQLISMGKSAEESGTIMERFIKNTLTDKGLRKIFQDAGGGTAGMMKVIEVGAKKTGQAQDEYFRKFGQYGLSVQLLAKNFDQLQNNVTAATDPLKIQDSVLKEFENRTNTTAFKLQQAKAEFQTMAIAIGNEVIPVVVDLLKAVKPIILNITSWISRNRELTGNIAKTAVVAAGLAFSISGIAFAVNAFSKTIHLAKAGLAVYNLVLGISTALQGKSAFYVMGNTVAYKGYRLAVKAAAIQQSILNGTILANPYVLAAIAVVGLGVAIYALTRKNNELTASQKAMQDVSKRVMENTIDQRVEVALLFKALGKATVGSNEFKATLAKIEEMQPGITKKFNLQAGAVRDLAAAEAELTRNIMARAFEDAKAQMMHEKMKELLTTQQEGPTFWDSLQSQWENLITLNKNTSTKFSMHEAKIQSLQAEFDALANLSSDDFVKTLNPQMTQTEAITKSITEKKQNTNITINDKTGTASVQSDNNITPITFSSTKRLEAL